MNENKGVESKDLTRRDFLKLCGSATLGVLIGGTIGKVISNPVIEYVTTTDIENADLSEDAKRMLSEIKQFRNSLGLDDYPPEMSTGIANENRWSGEIPTFNLDELPLKNLSYGMYIKEVTTNLFGENAARLVRGCQTDPRLPGVMAFEPNTRLCLLPENAHVSPIDNFINFILHEAGGHGSDPFVLTAQYPRETFTRVEHGKWCALTQMFAVPGEFLNNPGDMMYPMLKRNLGRIVGRAYVDAENTIKVLDDRGQIQVESVINSIAQAQGRDKKNLKFNKKVCRDIGETIVPAALDHKLLMKGDLKTMYAKTMENVGREIYAEMLKYSVLYPEKINNEHIFKGIAEVLEAIKGNKVDLRALGKMVASPSKEVVNRNIAEGQVEQVQQDRGQVIVESPQPILPPQEQEIIATQQREFEAKMSNYDNFINFGKLPSSLKISPDKANSVREFTSLYVATNAENPGLINVDIINNDGFDPDMHIWDIEDLGYALNTSFVLGILQASEVSGKIYGEILKKTAILKRFVGVHIWP